jgi:hypothetical protein
VFGSEEKEEAMAFADEVQHDTFLVEGIGETSNFDRLIILKLIEEELARGLLKGQFCNTGCVLSIKTIPEPSLCRRLFGEDPITW